MEFGERTRDFCPVHAGKEDPDLAMMGRLVGFPELWLQCGVSHKVRRGAQGASHVAPGKSNIHAHGERGARHCSRVMVGD